MKSTAYYLTTFLLALGVSADWGPSIPLPPSCGKATDVLVSKANGASCFDDSVPLVVNGKEVHCLCGGTKIREAIVKEVIPKLCKELEQKMAWVEWFNGHCKDTRNFKSIVVTNVQQFG